MAVVLSRASQVYAPRTLNLSPNVPAGVKLVRMTLTRESWPDGEVAQITVNYPDGTNALVAGLSGGAARDSVSIVGLRSEDGLPPGAYGVTIVVKQVLQTAVTVEGFNTTTP